MANTELDDARPVRVDAGHLLLIGAGGGLGTAIARRFVEGGYRLTVVARSADRVAPLVTELASSGAVVQTVVADASEPQNLRAELDALYLTDGAPGVIAYNAVLGSPDHLLTSNVDHLREAYAVDVIGAVVTVQAAAPAMQAAGFGTIVMTGGGFADHPIAGLGTVSLGKAALRSAAILLAADLSPAGIRITSVTIAGQIAAETGLDPEHIADRYWHIVHADEQWQTEYRYPA
jgi:short-subunit dehydrogenase